jgi:hypothetical protein
VTEARLVIANDQPASKQHCSSHTLLARGPALPPAEDDDVTEIIKQPETRPISQKQLVAEVKGIYAGLVSVESKCIEVDNNQSSQTDPANKLNHDQWQALIALHRTLLHEHHDFFLASQHHSASPAFSDASNKPSHGRVPSPLASAPAFFRGLPGLRSGVDLLPPAGLLCVPVVVMVLSLVARCGRLVGRKGSEPSGAAGTSSLLAVCPTSTLSFVPMYTASDGAALDLTSNCFVKPSIPISEELSERLPLSPLSPFFRGYRCYV